MSSILITSRLREAWRAAAKNQASLSLARLLSTSDGDRPLRPAPAPSSLPPPPEEYGEVVRSLLPFMGRSVPASTISAIIASHSAVLGIAPSAIYPFQYLSGLNHNADGFLLSWSSDYAGVPYICNEPFPLVDPTDSFNGSLGALVSPYPALAMGRIVFHAYDNYMLFPHLIQSADGLVEETLAQFTHPRELARLPASPALVMEQFRSVLRYTGCVRLPTPTEIDQLFDTVLTEGRLLKSTQINFRDLFSLMSMSASVVETAITEASRMDRDTRPSAPQPTNVAAPVEYVRRASRRQIIEPPDLISAAPLRASRRTTSYFTEAVASPPPSGLTASEILFGNQHYTIPAQPSNQSAAAVHNDPLDEAAEEPDIE